MAMRQGGDSRPSASRRRLYRKRLHEAQGGCCAWCRTELPSPDAGDLDRIIPGAEGGTYRYDNLALSCRPCNLTHGCDVRWKRAEPRKEALCTS